MNKLHKFEIGDMIRWTKTTRTYIGPVTHVNINISKDGVIIGYTVDACGGNYSFNEKDTELVEIVKKEVC